MQTMFKLMFKLSCVAVLGLAAFVPTRGAVVDFGREVYPIFKRSCFECHDAKLQKAKLRLDSRELAFKNPEVIVKGDAAKSELYRRIILPKGHDDIMPSRGEPLAKAQIEIVKSWINAGAVWPDGVQAGKHWAYVTPVRPAVPERGQPARANSDDSQAGRPRSNPIDAFILARLAKEGM